MGELRLRRSENMKGKFKLNHLIVHLILLVGVIVVVFPFAWMILTSFKTSGEAMKIPPTIFPEKFVTTAYHTIVTSAIPFATNPLKVTVSPSLIRSAACLAVKTLTLPIFNPSV